MNKDRSALSVTCQVMYSPTGFAYPSVPTLVAYASGMQGYAFSEHHPMDPARLELTHRLARDLGIYERDGVSLHEPRAATESSLKMVHDPAYIEAVKEMSLNPSLCFPDRGLGTEDNPGFSAMHESSSLIYAASVDCAEALLEERAVHAVNFAGGLHHAQRNLASGFCVYNDAAGAIARLLKGGVHRVLYIDIDAHHGDGTQSIFYDDPRVMTISLHESGLSLFPGSGFPAESGGEGAQGTSVNLPLPAGTCDAGWLRAFHSVIPQLAKAFAPEVIVSQHGCDSHGRDQLTNLKVSVDAQRAAALSIAGLSHSLCEGRWIATGGGGYDIVSTVPRVWTHLMAIAAGAPIPVKESTPLKWRQYVAERYEVAAPETMGDGQEIWWRSWEAGYDPADAVDRSIMATRQQLFPDYGLDPWFD